MAIIKSSSEKVKEFITGIIGLVIIIAVVKFSCKGSDESSESSKKQIPRKDRIDKQFSYDGSHKKLKEYIKSILNDPDSYENIKTVFWDRDSIIVVKTEFTAKNGYGGRVRNIIMANCDTLEGNIIKITMNTLK